MTREPAPGALGLVQRFVNTRDIEGDRDTLNKPDDLRDFFVDANVIEPGVHVEDADLERARAVREALRALLYHNAGEPLDAAAIQTLNAYARDARLLVRFTDEGVPDLEPCCAGVDTAIARIVAAVFAAVADGSWTRLKACRRDTCRWAFYDASKNGSSRWCSMEVCGSREKAK